MRKSKGCILLRNLPTSQHSCSDFRAINSLPDCFLNAPHPLSVRIPCFNQIKKQKVAPYGTTFYFWRRARDSNPRTGFDLLHDFQSCSFGQLGQLSIYCLLFPKHLNIINNYFLIVKYSIIFLLSLIR